MDDRVKRQLQGLPAQPGVYLFRDRAGEVLYVGKAKSLRSRVRSYFQKTSDGRVQIRQLPQRVADVEVIVTGSEVEALHLEQNLVKRHRPPFNVRLRDDKSFPYIAVTVEDEYPRVMFTRERHRPGVWYFGPYANAKKVRETLDVLNRVFPYRPCEGPKPGRHSGIPCLDYHIDRCLAPCVGYVTEEEYRGIVDGVIEFLSGDVKPIQRELERKMRDAAAEERFEDAARYRNRLFAVQHLVERQAVERQSVGTVDVIGFAAEERSRRRPDLPAARRQDGRPALVPPRERRRPGRDDDPRVVRARVLRQRPERSAADRRPARRGGPLGARRVPLRAARRAGRGAGGRARREAAAAAARGRERAASPAQRRRAGGAAAAAPRRGARAAARGAQPRVAAAADRVLRHLDGHGAGQRRLDGRLPGRAAEEGALPQVRDPRPGRDGRLRRDGGDDLAPLRAALRRDRRSSTTSRSRARRTSS